MKKKVISMILTGALAATVLAGCGNKTEAPAQGSATEETAEAAEETAEAAAETAEAAVIDFDEDPYEIAITLIGLNESNNDLEKVEEAVNAITLPKINATVDIQPLFIGDMGTTTTMGIAGGEKMDIVTVGLIYSLSNAVSDGVLLPLDDLLAERGPVAAEVTKNVAAAQKIDGVTYALSGYPYCAISGGIVYNKTIADELGIEMHDEMTWDELTEVGEKLKEKGIYLTKFGNSSQLNLKFESNYDCFGSSGEYGVLMEPADSSQIVNIYESELFEKFCERNKVWFDNGYLPADQMTDSTSVQQMFADQKVFLTSTSYTPDQLAVWTNPNFESALIRMAEPLVTTGGAVEMMLGIAATSERPDKCMDLLNLIYEDGELATLLNYGIEGLDYVKVEGTENVITMDGTANADHSGYYTTFSHFGDPMKRKVVAPVTDQYYDDLKAFNDEARTSTAFGYSFNADQFPTEAAAISAVLQEKLPMLNAGQVSDVHAAVEDLKAALDQAGMNDVIAGNQEQLDAYLAK